MLTKKLGILFQSVYASWKSANLCYVVLCNYIVAICVFNAKMTRLCLSSPHHFEPKADSTPRSLAWGTLISNLAKEDTIENEGKWLFVVGIY